MGKTYNTGDQFPASEASKIANVAGGYATSTTGNDTYVITVAPVPASYADGDEYTFKPDTANTGAATLNVNSLGAKTLKKFDTTGKVDLETGDLAANMPIRVKYDGTDFVVISRMASDAGVRANGHVTMNGGATQAIPHGMNGTPKRVWIFANGQADTGLYAGQSEGVYDGSGQNCRYLVPNSNGGNLFPVTLAGSVLYMRWSTNALKFTQGVITSVDATNINIAWTYGSAGSIVSDILFIVER